MAKKDDKDDNVTRFPSAKQRRIRLQKPANDVPSEPIFNLPPVTQNFTFLLLGVHIILLFLSDALRMQIIHDFSFIPARYTGEMPFDIYAIVSPITHMALHSGWMHIIMNVGMLMAFGSGVEKTFGGRRMIELLLVSGIVGALTHMVFYYDSPYPLLGASGGISGLFAAMLVLLNDKGGDKKKLMIVVAVWIGISLFFGLVGAPGMEGNIAWTTHIGGFFAGLGLSYHWIKNRN